MTLLCSNPLLALHGTLCKNHSSPSAPRPLHLKEPPPGMLFPYIATQFPLSTPSSLSSSITFSGRPAPTTLFKIAKTKQTIGPSLPCANFFSFFAHTYHLPIDYLNSSLSPPSLGCQFHQDRDFVVCSPLNTCAS